MDFFLVERIAEEAVLPILRSPNAAGYDLFSLDDLTIDKNGMNVVRTGLKIRQMPNGMHGMIRSVYEISLEKNLCVAEENIDTGYHEEIKITVFNHSQENNVLVCMGDRIAQVVFHQFISPRIVQRAIVAPFNSRPEPEPMDVSD